MVLKYDSIEKIVRLHVYWIHFDFVQPIYQHIIPNVYVEVSTFTCSCPLNIFL